MKSSFLFAILLSGMLALSCNDRAGIADTGYIKSKINGVETIYDSSVDNNRINFLSDKELHLSFHKDGNKYLTWTIDILGVDFKNVKLPLVITGPKAEGSNEPAFWCNITDTDPKHSAYGKKLVGTTSLYWNATLTLTSIEGNTVKGTFEGEGVEGEEDHPVTFTDGAFLVILK